VKIVFLIKQQIFLRPRTDKGQVAQTRIYTRKNNKLVSAETIEKPVNKNSSYRLEWGFEMIQVDISVIFVFGVLNQFPFEWQLF
jgi:hypothetical protein